VRWSQKHTGCNQRAYEQDYSLRVAHFAPFFADFFTAFFGLPDSFFGRVVSSGNSQ
jgi:hypothetical protein